MHASASGPGREEFYNFFTIIISIVPTASGQQKVNNGRAFPISGLWQIKHLSCDFG